MRLIIEYADRGHRIRFKLCIISQKTYIVKHNVELKSNFRNDIKQNKKTDFLLFF